ncbi:NAD(P)H-dependent oxidoreductase [Candidatus Gracilibacteria bacterium]|nr:NAD(P)H-dependent oxidoreductase [Candidatus Gracilibacteria bacterium]
MQESKIIHDLKWRYAVKKFDASKKVSKEDLNIFLESLRLTASSFGLQPWKFVVVENPDIRSKLLEHSYNQAQVVDASHLIVLCRNTKIDATLVNDYIDDIIQKTGADTSSLEGYKNMMLGFISNLDENNAKAWAEKQVYIALGNALSSLAQLKIDSCPMEGFSPEKYDEILGLTELGLASVVILPIGYRSGDDTYASNDKFRYDSEKMILKI